MNKILILESAVTVLVYMKGHNFQGAIDFLTHKHMYHVWADPLKGISDYFCFTHRENDLTRVKNRVTVIDRFHVTSSFSKIQN